LWYPIAFFEKSHLICIVEMFGGRRNDKERESLSKAMQPDNPSKKSGGSSVTGFDPEGLERAAKAARELDASRNATQAVELIKTQEATKQVSSCYPSFVIIWSD
jgi:hypothetical protein